MQCNFYITFNRDGFLVCHVQYLHSLKFVCVQYLDTVKGLVIYRDAPNMLKNLPIIPSRTSQNLSLLFFKIPPIIPKLFRSDSKKIIAIAN